MFPKTEMLVGLAIAAVFAAPVGMAQSDGSSMHSKQDTVFVAKASSGGMTEVAASKLAEAHAKSDDVKSFAKTMIADHTKAGDELAQTAQKDGYMPAAGPTSSQQAKLTKLGTLNGEAFDKAYKSMMVMDHKQTVTLFKKEAASGKISDLKSFASETLPTLEHHLAMATKL